MNDTDHNQTIEDLDNQDVSRRRRSYSMDSFHTGYIDTINLPLDMTLSNAQRSIDNQLHSSMGYNKIYEYLAALLDQAESGDYLNFSVKPFGEDLEVGTRASLSQKNGDGFEEPGETVSQEGWLNVRLENSTQANRESVDTAHTKDDHLSERASHSLLHQLCSSSLLKLLSTAMKLENVLDSYMTIIKTSSRHIIHKQSNPNEQRHIDDYVQLAPPGTNEQAHGEGVHRTKRDEHSGVEQRGDNASEPSGDPVFHSSSLHYTQQIDIACYTFFAVELLLRFIVAPSQKTFVRRLENIVDFICVCLFLLEMVIEQKIVGDDVNTVLGILFTLRIMRIVRVFRVAFYHKGFQVCGIFY